MIEYPSLYLYEALLSRSDAGMLFVVTWSAAIGWLVFSARTEQGLTRRAWVGVGVTWGVALCCLLV